MGAATSAPRPACSTMTAMATRGRLGRGEPDEPRVRLAAAAELGRAGLAGGRHARDLGARGELLADRPRRPGTMAALMAVAAASMTRADGRSPIGRELPRP